MADFLQNDESKRFLEVVEELIKLKVVDSAATFCRQIGYDPKSFSHIKTGKRNVPIEIIGKLYTIFAGNPIYIVSGRGSLLFDDHISSAVQEPSATYHQSGNEQDEIARLNRLIDSMISNAQVNLKYVKSLEEKINELEAEVSHLQKKKEV